MRHLRATSVICVITSTTAYAATDSNPSSGGWTPIPLVEIATHSTTDPAGIWSSWDIPKDGADFWLSQPLKVGSSISLAEVGQIVTADCGLSGSCPTKVYISTYGQSMTTKRLKMCAHPTDLRMSSDGLEVIACGRTIPLENEGHPGVLSRLIAWLRSLSA